MQRAQRQTLSLSTAGFAIDYIFTRQKPSYVLASSVDAAGFLAQILFEIARYRPEWLGGNSTRRILLTGERMEINFDPRLPFAERIAFFADRARSADLKSLYLKAMDSVDWPRIERIRHEGADQMAQWPKDLIYKYLDVPYRTWARLTQIELFGLANSAPMRILDLGCGVAHF